MMKKNILSRRKVKTPQSFAFSEEKLVADILHIFRRVLRN